ncbi:hypothetical protein ACINKY_21215 [Paenibacillus illinoisensis]|uniref:Uncharacterized protein n=1 Tax=Paenibacillus illinoisensis TaxID=59845 RepID=A0ABW8HZP5_9BACL
MWEPVRFLLFSSIETMSAFTLMLAAFRIKVKDFFWSGLFVSLFMNLQSYLLRGETSLSALAPAISTMIFAFLLVVVVKIPAMWSALIAVLGTFVYTVIQFVILKTLFAGVDTATLSTSIEGSALQLVTSIVVFGISYFLLKFKIGFTSEFDNFTLHWANIGVVVLIVIGLLGSTLMFYLNDLFLLTIHMAIVAILFLYYAIKKEREE